MESKSDRYNINNLSYLKDSIFLIWINTLGLSPNFRHNPSIKISSYGSRINNHWSITGSYIIYIKKRTSDIDLENITH